MTVASATARSERLLRDPPALKTHIQHRLQAVSNPGPLGKEIRLEDDGLSVVLFLLGVHRSTSLPVPEPCVILNKRSSKVRQPGDICCPGGGIAPRFDRLAAHLLRLPLSPLRRWTHYAFWRKRARGKMGVLRLLAAAALREGLEEMRLNPLVVSFQGMLPIEHLVMFRRTIVPMVAWVEGQRRYHPNWEVEKIIRIPLRDLLAPDHYVRLRLAMNAPEAGSGCREWMDFPAFRHRSVEANELLWGATYRITMNFLDRVFGFRPPDPDGAPVVQMCLTSAYLTGRG